MRPSPNGSNGRRCPSHDGSNGEKRSTAATKLEKRGRARENIVGRGRLANSASVERCRIDFQSVPSGWKPNLRGAEYRGKRR